MKSLKPYLLAVGMMALAQAGNAATILFQNFDTSPINYVLPPGSEFIQDTTLPTKYWNLSNALGTSLNPAITGDNTTYLTGQNMDAPLPFTTSTPAQMDFTVNVAGLSNLRFSFDVAGLSSPEPENYIRILTDDDNDGFFETFVINFAGTGNAPYTEASTGEQLTANFQTFRDLPLNFPTAADRNLRVRLELFDDTDSLNEAIGVDNIEITGVPEPTAGLLVLTGVVAATSRRRRGDLEKS